MSDERTMKSKTLKIAAGVAGALVLTSGVQAGTDQPSARELTRAVTQYLSDHGDLCVGKFAWPRVVTQQDQAAHTNDAVQLPVLERLGLVESTEISAPAAATPASWTPSAADAGGNAAAQGSPQSASAAATGETARRYSLTTKGQRYYLQKKRITLGAHDRPVEHDKDLCVARLSLDKVVKWSPPEAVHGHPETVVRYTYHVKSAADWMTDPQARQVFPVVDRIIRNQDNMLMSVTVQLQDGKWVPVLPGQ
jgi:hypothetical protein